MLGWVYDAGARSVCRSYDAVVGHMPMLCQTNGGRPLFALVAGALSFLLVLVLIVRTFRP